MPEHTAGSVDFLNGEVYVFLEKLTAIPRSREKGAAAPKVMVWGSSASALQDGQAAIGGFHIEVDGSREGQSRLGGAQSVAFLYPTGHRFAVRAEWTAYANR